MFAVRDTTTTLIITDDLDFAETYALDRFNRLLTFVEVVRLDDNKVVLSFETAPQQ